MILSMVSLVASHLLDREMKYNDANTNTGGWANCSLNRILNSIGQKKKMLRIL